MGHLKVHELGNFIVRWSWYVSHQVTAALRCMHLRPRIIRAYYFQWEL